MAKHTVNGTTLYYEQHGAGLPLVLIAGFSCDTTFWQPILKDLAQHFHVTIFDNRGIGQSDRPDLPYFIEDMANDTVALMDELGIKEAHILGHSMGGAIAQHIAFTHPQRVENLILANSLIKMNQVSVLTEQFLLKLRQDDVPLRRILEGTLPWIFSSAFLSSERQVEKLIEIGLTNPFPQTPNSVKGQLNALVHFDSSQWFKKINVRTLVIGADEDILCPRQSQALAAGIPGAQFVNITGTGHASLIEKPREFIRVVEAFLAKATNLSH